MAEEMSETPVVGIAAGQLRGRAVDGVAAFKGIPYGESVSRRQRWQRSSPPTPWNGIRDAVEFGPRAIQPESRDMRVTSPEIEALMTEGGPQDDRWRAQSEECLTLNVWTSDTSLTRKLPVMFWCHGGKYFGETPPVWWFDGEQLARIEDVIVVTARHRVGVFGFLHLADLPGGGAYQDAANVGMLDLVDALRWVRDNIASFGGDPDNVTIFGESGGGLKVSVLLGMPDAKGLFHKAIIQSGAQIAAEPRAKGTADATALLEELGLPLDNLDQLLDVPPERLVEAQIRLLPNLWARPEGVRSAIFEPVIDGRILPSDCLDPAASEVSRDVPLLIGTCATETTFFLSSIPGVFEMDDERMRRMVGGMLGAEGERILGLYRSSRPDASPADVLFAITTDFMFRRKAIHMAEAKSKPGRASVYMYVLAFETDVGGGRYRTPHILDLPLVFAHPEHPLLGGDPARFAVSRQMSGAWAAFARTGDPGTALLPHWPAYDVTERATMYFQESPSVVADPRAAERAAWQ